MQIIWKGQSCFQITAQVEKNLNINLVLDPFSEEIGLGTPKLEADILLITHSHSDHNNKKAVTSSKENTGFFVIDGPGEYDLNGVFVQGISSWHDEKEGKERGNNTIFTMDVEDLRICHLGDIWQKELTEKQVEEIGEVDILMIPVGGTYTVDAKGAAKIISQIEPKIVIPMHFQIPKLKVKIDGVDDFLKVMGVKAEESQAKISIKKKDLPEEGVKIFVLKN